MRKGARSAVVAVVSLLVGCGDNGGDAGAGGGGGPGGGDGGSGAGKVDGVSVSVSPKAVPVAIGGTIKLAATVTGSSDTAVSWALQEASGCGSLTDDGVYTAPSSVPDPVWCHVEVTSHAEPSASDTSTITVTNGATSGKPGEWTNVTPALNLDPDYPSVAQNYGVQDVVADPARPSDLYAFVCYQGVWRSTDYGLNWAKVSTGENGAILDQGRPWGAAIDPNPSRDPEKAPALYTANGYGPQAGVYKSTDWGKNWTYYDFPDAQNDVYSFDIDPYDSDHILAGFHETSLLAESKNGGKNWSFVDIPSDFGISIYPSFVDTGNAGTTHGTWVTIAQAAGGVNGIWRTTNAGGDWDQVETLEHSHGGAQMFRAGNGVIYAAGVYGTTGWGVFQSDDAGATWNWLFETNIGESSVVGTAKFLYASSGGASQGMLDPSMMSAPRDGSTPWAPMAAPSGMTNGAKRVAVTSDGKHSILVSGNWLAGIWRYVE